MTYRHTQSSPLWLLLIGLAIVCGGAAIASTGDPWLPLVLAVVASVFALLGLCFKSLTIEDAGEVLRVRFGPVPLFRAQFRYADMTSVCVARSAFIDGWGIHYIPGRGWTYNLWGYDCVGIRMGSRLYRIGTDDPTLLNEFLRRRAGLVGGAPESGPRLYPAA